MKRRLTLGFLLLACPSLSAQASLFRYAGEASENFGRTVASVGDLDGDGFDEVAVGAPLAELGGEVRGRVEVISARTRTVLYTFHGDVDGDQLGFSVANAGDVDGDLTDDIIAGAFGGSYARIWSGADGSVIRTLTTPGPTTDFFGYSVASAGDLDGDDMSEVVVGSDRFALFDPGFAQVFRGSNGTPSLTFNGDQPFDGFGNAVAGGGDVDGDGVLDVVVGQPRVDVVGTDSGRVRVYSGATGLQIRLFDGDAAGERFGTSVAIVDDVNGDGRDEVAVGAPICGSSLLCGPTPGYVRLFDGQTGGVLYTLRSNHPYSLYGAALSAAGDVDRDGAGDFVIGIASADDRADADVGSVRVISGATGKTLYQYFGDKPGDMFGTTVSSLGDLNGDGFPDVFAGSEGGYARALSLALGRSGAQVSLSAGGAQQMSLVAGPAHARGLVALMGTLLGTTPGTPMGGLKLPLNIGLFAPVSGKLIKQQTFLSLRAGSSTPLQALVSPGNDPVLVRVGRLDAVGEAHIALQIPPGSYSGLAGLTVHHAFVVFNEPSNTAAFVSNPIALELLP